MMEGFVSVCWYMSICSHDVKNKHGGIGEILLWVRLPSSSQSGFEPGTLYGSPKLCEEWSLSTETKHRVVPAFALPVS